MGSRNQRDVLQQQNVAGRGAYGEKILKREGIEDGEAALFDPEEQTLNARVAEAIVHRRGGYRCSGLSISEGGGQRHCVTLGWHGRITSVAQMVFTKAP